MAVATSYCGGAVQVSSDSVGIFLIIKYKIETYVSFSFYCRIIICLD